MNIDSISITNFRGYKEKVVIPFNNLTVFVGKNDAGKSTILEALDIFFHDGKGTIKIDKQDINIHSIGNQDIVISVTFDKLPNQIILDASSTTSLQAEYLLNSEHKLEVMKVFHNAGTPKVYIRAIHPTNPECADLLLKKNPDLKAIVRNYNLKCENQSSNVKLREAIWNHFADNLQLKLIQIDVSKEDAKMIWEKLSSNMPVYSLFQSDRKNCDNDNEVQDPLQEAVKQILCDSELQATLASVADVVTRKLQEVSSRTLEKLHEMDPEIANSLNPVIPSADALKWSDVFKKVSISGDEDIPINKRGSGIKRLILLNFFRAEAERRYKNGENTGVIYAIEEPETSQHTANQRVLIHALKSLSHSPNTQVILTTHSGVIVKELDFSSIRLVSEVNHKKQVLEIQPGVLRYPSLNEVNFSAFDEASEEYHDELYGFLYFHKWFKDYKTGKPTIPYKRMDDNGAVITMMIIESEYIRHQIHHPENTLNTKYTKQQLKNSIESMREYIRARAEVEGFWDPIDEY